MILSFSPELITAASAALLLGLLLGWLFSRLRAQREKTALMLETERLRAALASQDALREQFRQLSREALEQQGRQLLRASEDSLDNVLDPLYEHLHELGLALRHTHEKGVEGRASLEATVRALMEQATHIGAEARQLTRVLKGDSKFQGNWGELVMERMLEAAGLRRGEEYAVQPDFRQPDGSHLRPDLVLLLPGERRLVVDSKVSLTAYARVVEAGEDARQRRAALREHVNSVRRHVEELAARNYAHVVEGSLDVVLMFIPNEASYMAAVQVYPTLVEEALKRGVLVVSPTTLLMAVQVARHLWARERQSRNVQTIIEKASALYNQFALFTENFARIGRELDLARQAYDDSLRQLTTGKGNVCRRFEQLRALGLTPAKSPALRPEDEEGGITPPLTPPAGRAGSRG